MVEPKLCSAANLGWLLSALEVSHGCWTEAAVRYSGLRQLTSINTPLAADSQKYPSLYTSAQNFMLLIVFAQTLSSLDLLMHL